MNDHDIIMNDLDARPRAAQLQQICGWLIAAAYLLSAVSILIAYIKPEFFYENRDLKNIIVCAVESLSFGTLAFLVGNRQMKLGFVLLVLGVLTSLLNDVRIIGDSRTLMITLDMIQWLLIFAGLVSVCVGGDLIRRFPRLSAAYLFFIGSSAAVILAYVAAADNRLFWFYDRSEFYIWVDGAYCLARCASAVPFWIAVLRVSYPDDGRPVISRPAYTSVIAFIAATAVSGVVFNIFFPMLS